jgi:hypothetical protein
MGAGDWVQPSWMASKMSLDRFTEAYDPVDSPQLCPIRTRDQWHPQKVVL